MNKQHTTLTIYVLSKWKTYDRKKREVSYENENPEDVKDNDKKIYLSDFDPKSPSAQELSSSLNQKKEQEI